MVRKKLDERIRLLLERSVATGQRSILVLVGDRGKDQIPNIHQIVTKTAAAVTAAAASTNNLILNSNSTNKRPNVLWCYKKDLGFSTHKQKRLKKLKRDKARGMLKTTTSHDNNSNVSSADLFELFISQTDINWCYYRDTHRILGTTNKILILQDFESITPNILARTIETVSGGGLIIFLFSTVSSLQQLYTMTMDVHNRYRTDTATETGGDIIPRFNERFILSLGNCINCLVCDDELNILPLSRKSLQSLSTTTSTNTTAHDKQHQQQQHQHERGDNGEVIVQETKEQIELYELKESFIDTPHIGSLIDLTKTLDQAKAVLVFLDACTGTTSSSSNNSTLSTNNITVNSSSNNNNSSSITVAMTSGRGRGKSAAIGLCIAGAISFGYTSIAVTAPDVENLVSVFDFILRGLTSLKYVEHIDYTISYNTNKAGRDSIKCITGIQFHSNNNNSISNNSTNKRNINNGRQFIKYIEPNEIDKFTSCEIIAIDEAAAIPLPIVKALMTLQNTQQGRLTFLSSTINGYEGTGRALSLKLIKELRDTNSKSSNNKQLVLEPIPGTNSTSSKKGERKVHEQRWAAAAANAIATTSLDDTNNTLTGPLREIVLSTPIRYSENDPIEKWLNKLLCLDCGSNTDTSNTNNNTSSMYLQNGAPAVDTCELYYVNRDALFSYHKISESFLQKLMLLYTSAHYKNTPNDLQMLSDAPAHHLYVLLGPQNEQQTNGSSSTNNNTGDKNNLPDVLVIIQVAYEGKISRKVIDAQLARGHRSAGDLIPWTISQQFSDSTFGQLSGARIVRIAVHPTVQSMGYGTRAMSLLFHHYNGDLLSFNMDTNDNNDDEDDEDGDDDKVDEEEVEESDNDVDDNNDDNDDDTKKKGILQERIKPRKELPPLLVPISDIKRIPTLDWIGTSFGLTIQLHKFWSKLGFKLLYIRQTKNELTGENSAIMIKPLPKRSTYDSSQWLQSFTYDTLRRFITLLGGPFRDIDIRLATSVIDNLCTVQHRSNRSTTTGTSTRLENRTTLDATELECYMSPHDTKRLELYGRNLCDHHLIADLVPVVARLYFQGRLCDASAVNSENSSIVTNESRYFLSSVQAALMCGIGLQQRTIDSLTTELSLPSNQVLAMFNKAIRKLSISLNAIVVSSEKKAMMSSSANNGSKSNNNVNKQRTGEELIERMKNVTEQTLDEDMKDAALQFQQEQKELAKSTLPPEISDDPELMQYIVKGTDEQWKYALKTTTTTTDNNDERTSTNKNLDAIGSIQIQSIREKRKMHSEDDDGNDNKNNNEGGKQFTPTKRSGDNFSKSHKKTNHPSNNKGNNSSNKKGSSSKKSRR